MDCLEWKVEIERPAGIVRIDDIDRFACKDKLQEKKFAKGEGGYAL